LNEQLGVRFDLAGFGRHRGVVCLHGERELSAAVSNTDPGFRREGPFGLPNDRYEPHPLPCVPLDDTEVAARTASRPRCRRAARMAAGGARNGRWAARTAPRGETLDRCWTPRPRARARRAGTRRRGGGRTLRGRTARRAARSA